MKNTNLSNISKLFNKLKLGDVIEEPINVMGGLLHKMYKVKIETSMCSKLGILLANSRLKFQ